LQLSKSRKFTIPVLIFSIFFVFSSVDYFTYGQNNESESQNVSVDSLWQEFLDEWLGSIILEVIMGLGLSFLFYYYETRQGAQLEQVILNQESMRIKKEKYATYDLKNHFTNLLLSIGLINRSVKKFNDESSDKEKHKTTLKEHDKNTKHILDLIRTTLMFSSDVMEPELITEINSICQTVENDTILEKDGQLSFPEYDNIKKHIFDVTKKLPEV